MPIPKGDGLKTPEEAYLADPRSNNNSISDQYNRIVEFKLAEYVPENISAQYEVARNLYLFAHNVYRFYMTAHHQALITLEFAIKERYGKKKIKRYGEKHKKGSGLAACLCYVFDKGIISNSDFAAWINRRRMDAEHKFGIQKIEEMNEKGLDSIEVDYNDIDYENHPFEYDYLDVLSDALPYLRNMHAHGTSTLNSSVLMTFENVSVIINKIFAPSSNN